jgi:hypothetical protein
MRPFHIFAAESDLRGFERAAPVHWPQAATRRAHQAMLDFRSTDLLTLARAALHGRDPP